MTFAEFQEFVTNGSDEEVLGRLPVLPDEETLEFISYADAEICNGGFNQFYGNGIFDARKLIEELERVELQDQADIVRRSLAKFPEGVQPMRTEQDPGDSWNRVIDLVGGKKEFYELENEYYSRTDQITPALANHVRKNAAHYFQYVRAAL